MTTTTSIDRRGRWLVLLLAAVLTLATTVLFGAVAGAGVASAATVSSAGSSSAPTVPALESRVGASTQDLILVVGGQTGIGAGQGRGDVSSQSQFVSGWCVAAEGEGTWFQVTKAGANRAATFVPESFDLSVAGENFSVVPNATKHIAEYATSTGAGSMPMSSFAGAVETAVKQELGIDTTDNVIYHAVYRP